MQRARITPAPVDLSNMDAETIIARIPPLPRLRLVSHGSSGRLYWEPDEPALLKQSYAQAQDEPWERFLERATCYWRRGCALVLVKQLRLPHDEERALIRACWLQLQRPSELPGWPGFSG